MSADKRTVHTDALATLGTIIDETAKRDAIHIGVEPCIAGEVLIPGENIGIIDGKAYNSGCKLLGIADPFMKSNIKQGEMFWLLVYPRQITSLRHVWSHPDFSDSEIKEEVKESILMDKSKEWMIGWAKEHMSEDYYGDDNKPLGDEEAYSNAIEAGRNNHVGPYEGAEDYIDNTWWDHWETITGLKGNRDGYFSCSC